MKWYHWVGIGVLAVGVILFWIATGGRGPNPIEKVNREVDAINAKADVKRMQTELNTEQALAHVDEKYHDDLAAMDAERRARAEKLRHDPAKLAAFIVKGRSQT